MPQGTQAIIDGHSWQRPAVFDWLQQQGNIADEEMYRTFNCGIGMVLCVAAADVEQTLAILTDQGESATVIGHIAMATGDSEQVIIN
jgi:phosphoribosylformylglycinamidine cyclo-ligase